jgi:hypothetical protein
MSRFSSKNGAGVKEDRLVISDDEDDGETETKTSWRATPDTRKQQQPSPPSTPDDRRAPRQGLASLAGLVASGKTTPTKTAKITTSTTTPPSMSFSDTINRAKAATDESAAKAQQQDGPNSRTTTPSPPKKTQSWPAQMASHRGGSSDAAAAEDEDEDEDEEEDIALRIPGSFDLEGSGGGGAASTVEDDPYNVVNVLGNLWRRMQLRR